MRPSSIMTFEPGLEHGVPWGRDLFTFVTSAAGHMMRTLQRPRKNKPSKRQVNHRRFLHNMIQRKFAEIEAANHQLASSLFSTDRSQNHLTVKPSHTVIDELPKASKKAPNDAVIDDKTEPLIEQEDLCDLWTLDSLMEAQVTDKGFFQCKPLNGQAAHLSTGQDSKALKNRNQQERNSGNSMEKTTDFSYEKEHIQTASSDLGTLSQMTSNLLEDSVSTWVGSDEGMRTNSEQSITKYSDMKMYHSETIDLSPSSPVISLFSLDSCDLEVQMLIDAEHSVQTQDSNVAESLQMDMVDSFDLLDCSDSEGDLQGHNTDPKCKTAADWIVHNVEHQRCVQDNITFPSSLDLVYDMDNLNSGGGTQGFENGSQIISLLANTMTNLSQKGQEFRGNAHCSEEKQGCGFHYNHMNCPLNHKNILEDHFGQLEPCMISNGKDACYSSTDLSVSNQTVSDSVASNNFFNHHTFPELENQLDSQSKKFHFDNSEQQPGKSTHINILQCRETDQYHVLQDTDIRNADKNIVHVQSQSRSPSGLQWQTFPNIMPASCFEDFCYHKGESCSYSKFIGNQGSHNFEGVARSFPASLQKAHPTPIPTPPLDDDWLFSNIVTEEDENSTANKFGKY